MRSIRLIVIAAGFSAFTGCWGPATVPPPSYSPGAVADAAMSAYDTNKDGKLDAKELEACPALKNALKDLDKDNDSMISRSELEAQIAEFSKSKIALLTASCKVTRGGKPLEGAEVKFVPEKFHGGALKPAFGKSDAQGNVELRTEGAPHPGVSLGYYRIEVSMKSGGQETIPAAYNTQSTLGAQVHAQMRGAIEINIP